jgi:hypothetical protein
MNKDRVYANRPLNVRRINVWADSFNWQHLVIACPDSLEEP